MSADRLRGKLFTTSNLSKYFTCLKLSSLPKMIFVDCYVIQTNSWVRTVFRIVVLIEVELTMTEKP